MQIKIDSRVSVKELIPFPAGYGATGWICRSLPHSVASATRFGIVGEVLGSAFAFRGESRELSDASVVEGVQQFNDRRCGVVKQELPPAQQAVRVIAQQWAWSFVHPGPDAKLDTPDDIKTVDELHIQANTLYHYHLEARDVLHSFSIPVFRLKQDAVPGRIITGWFKAIKTGSYDIQCAEICGIGHGVMAGRIVIETPEQHAAWMAGYSPTAFGE